MSAQQKFSQGSFDPLIKSIPQNSRSVVQPSNQQLNFIAQAQSKANLSKLKPGQIPYVKPVNDCEACRSKFPRFGDLQYPILLFIFLLCLAVILIVRFFFYYKSKVFISSSSLIYYPKKLNSPCRVSNSNTSPDMTNSSEFSYLFWLFISPPTNLSNSNLLVFIRDSDIFPPKFCVYFSNNGGTLNVASLTTTDSSPITDQQKTYINKLQFDLVPDFYTVCSTNQISFYKWFFVSIIGYQNQLIIYVNSIPYSTNNNSSTPVLLPHSGFIDIAKDNKYTTFDNSYISKLTVYNHRINKNEINNRLRYSPQ